MSRAGKIFSPYVVDVFDYGIFDVFDYFFPFSRRGYLGRGEKHQRPIPSFCPEVNTAFKGGH